MSDQQKQMVKIYHQVNGEMEVTMASAENKLKYNHIKDGGSYCALNEVDYYFQPAPGTPSGSEILAGYMSNPNPELMSIIADLRKVPPEGLKEIRTVITYWTEDYEERPEDQDPEPVQIPPVPETVEAPQTAQEPAKSKAKAKK